MSRVLWYLTRSTGIVASVLLVAALVWGFFFSARETGRRLRPAWWLDLHNWLGGLALVLTAIHIAVSFLDSSSGIGLVQVFVPGTAGVGAWGIGFGVVATYFLMLVVFTSWPRRLGNRYWWRVLHLTSVVAAVLAILHSYKSGSDLGQTLFRAGLIALVAVATYALGLRLFSFDIWWRRWRHIDGLMGRFRSAEDSQLAHSSDSSPSNGDVDK